MNPIPKPEGKAPKRKLEPQEQTFQNGLTLSSTPTKRQRQEDEVDANKKTLKFFGVKVQVPKLLNLDCSSKTTEVIEISDEESITDPTLSRSEMEVNKSSLLDHTNENAQTPTKFEDMVKRLHYLDSRSSFPKVYEVTPTKKPIKLSQWKHHPHQDQATEMQLKRLHTY